MSGQLSPELVERVTDALGKCVVGSSLEEQAIAALEASGHAELLRCVRLLWQFHEPGDIPTDLEILVPEVLAKYPSAKELPE